MFEWVAEIIGVVTAIVCGASFIAAVTNTPKDDELLGKLPEHPNHPKGRNPYAHVALEVKNHFQMTYKDIPDEKFNDVVNYLEFLKQNPN